MKATRLQFARRKKFQRSRYVGMRRYAPSVNCIYDFPAYWVRIERRDTHDFVHRFVE